MNNYEKIYWLTRLDALQGLFIVMVIVSSTILGMFYLFNLMENEELPKGKYGFKTLFFGILFIGALGYTFTPTRNEAIIIMAGGKTMDYIQTDTSLSKIPHQTTTIISEYLDKTINELKKENK